MLCGFGETAQSLCSLILSPAIGQTAVRMLKHPRYCKNGEPNCHLDFFSFFITQAEMDLNEG